MPFPWQIPKMQDSSTPTNPKSSKSPFFSAVPNPMTAILSNPAAASFKSQVESAFQNLNIQAWRTLQLGFSNFFFPPNGFQFLARITPAGVDVRPRRRALPIKTIEERLSGVPVYALSNAAEEFVLVSELRTGKSVGLICFKRENAETLLHQMKSMNHEMREGSKVVAIALNKAFQLKVNGVAFRLIPDPVQVLNAVKLKEMPGNSAANFTGVPVFQSRSLSLRSRGKTYRPFFFRKEDLEDSLLEVSREQRRSKPAFKAGNIEVSALEEIISTMMEGSTSDCHDVVFIPPGFRAGAAVREGTRTNY